MMYSLSKITMYAGAKTPQEFAGANEGLNNAIKGA